MDSFSRDYFSTMDQAHPGIVGISSQIQQEGWLPEILPEWFAALWHVIRATEPMLQRCADRLESYEDDPFIERYAHTSTTSSKTKRITERGCWRTSIMWVWIATLSITSSPRHPSPRWWAASPTGSSSSIPAVYLGYIGLLEGYTASLDQVETVIESSGAPHAAFATYEFHQTKDIEHRKDLERILDAVPEDAFLRQAIVANGIRCTAYYCQALEGMLASARMRSTGGVTIPVSVPAPTACAS